MLIEPDNILVWKRRTQRFCLQHFNQKTLQPDQVKGWNWNSFFFMFFWKTDAYLIFKKTSKRYNGQTFTVLVTHKYSITSLAATAEVLMDREEAALSPEGPLLWRG